MIRKVLSTQETTNVLNTILQTLRLFLGRILYIFVCLHRNRYHISILYQISPWRVSFILSGNTAFNIDSYTIHVCISQVAHTFKCIGRYSRWPGFSLHCATLHVLGPKHLELEILRLNAVQTLCLLHMGFMSSSEDSYSSACWLIFFFLILCFNIQYRELQTRYIMEKNLKFILTNNSNMGKHRIIFVKIL